MIYGWFALLGFASSVLSSVFGFGSAMIVLALGPYFLPVHEVVALSAVLFIASTVTKTITFRSYLHWPLIGTITVGSLPFAYLGGLLLPHLSQQFLQRCLGVLIISYVCLQLPVIRNALRSVQDQFVPRASASASASASSKPDSSGAIDSSTARLIAVAAGYGFTSGLVGSGSVIKAIFFRQSGLEKEAFVGTMAATSVVATIGKLVAYTQTGLLHGPLLLPMLALVVAAVAAVLVGRTLLKKFDSTVFNRGVTLLLIVAAIGLLF